MKLADGSGFVVKGVARLPSFNTAALATPANGATIRGIDFDADALLAALAIIDQRNLLSSQFVVQLDPRPSVLYFKSLRDSSSQRRSEKHIVTADFDGGCS